MYAIEILNLTKSYANFKALDSISLQIPSGSFYGLIGPNGAGKSSIINILAGITKKTSGEILFYGKNYDEETAFCKKQIGVVPQELIIDTFFTLEENLHITAGYYGIRQADVENVLKVLSLWDKKDKLPKQLSGGMKRRFLIARALIHKPSILVLDEPTAGVDINLRIELWEYVSELNKSGTTVILTTHYLEEAEHLCSHITFIDKGKLLISDEKKSLMSLFGFKELIFECADSVKLDLEGYDVSYNANIINVRFNANQENPISRVVDKISKSKVEIINIETKQEQLTEVFKRIYYDK